MKRFPSVKKNSEFQVIYRNGTSYANRLLVMYVMKTGEDENRIGISVSKSGQQCCPPSYNKAFKRDFPFKQ